MTLDALLDRFTELRVGVLGDAMLDVYLEGTGERLCPEAPVPVIDVSAERRFPGGAANVVRNVRSLGARAEFFSVVGDDSIGSTLAQELRDREVDMTGVVVERGRSTLCKKRVIADGNMLLRLDTGNTKGMSAGSERSVLACLGERLGELDALIISDYGYGAVSTQLIQALTDLRHLGPRLTVVDSKDLTRFRSLAPAVVKPNFRQAMETLGTAIGPEEDRAEFICRHAGGLFEATGSRLAAVTLDSEGAIYIERGAPPYRTYSKPRRRWLTSGGGDTLVAALTLGLAAGADVPAAAELASRAADVSVATSHTAECTAVALRHHELVGSKYVGDLETADQIAHAYRRNGMRIVFTNGCFDIIHRGHITFLDRAKRLGDVLVVGVNSDESVRRLKGAPRPINRLEDRIEVLAALSCVDHIVPFEDDLPLRAIEAVVPHVFVKGGDYTMEMLPEASLVERLGGRVHLMPYEEGRSTSGLIDRIRNGSLDAAT